MKYDKGIARASADRRVSHWTLIAPKGINVNG